MELLKPIDDDIALMNFWNAHAGMRFFVQGGRGARILLAAAPHRLYLVFEGEAEGEQIVGALLDAKRAGLPASDEFSALVDMLPFTGSVNWRAIPQISNVMPKGRSTTNKNAYVVRDDITAALTKINSVLFPNTEHRAFDNEAEAVAWLGWK
jgi:hypothetical protein